MRGRPRPHCVLLRAITLAWHLVGAWRLPPRGPVSREEESLKIQPTPRSFKVQRDAGVGAPEPAGSGLRVRRAGCQAQSHSAGSGRSPEANEWEADMPGSWNFWKRIKAHSKKGLQWACPVHREGRPGVRTGVTNRRNSLPLLGLFGNPKECSQPFPTGSCAMLMSRRACWEPEA